MWNTDNNQKDLLNRNGDTYSGEIRCGTTTYDNYIMFTLQDGCGGEFQAIFDLDKEIRE